MQSLAEDLKEFFLKELDLSITVKTQKFRIYLKFPVLHELNLAKKEESNFLFLKIEVFNRFDFCQNFTIEVKPLFKFGRTVLVRTFDLPTLMATKLNAVLHRKWEKTDKKGVTLIRVKGRDFFDLMWYFQKGVVPNFHCIPGVQTQQELNQKLGRLIENLDPQSIRLDLMGLVPDPKFVEDLSKNLKNILMTQIKK